MAEIKQQSSKKDVVKHDEVRKGSDIETAAPINHAQERIKKWLKLVRFKKTLFGGVDEADVWKKIAELNSLYEAALSGERARYDALLAERSDSTEHGKAGDGGNG